MQKHQVVTYETYPGFVQMVDVDGHVHVLYFYGDSTDRKVDTEIVNEGELSAHPLIDTPELRTVGKVADQLGYEAYVVGGFVRDLFLGRPNKDIDVVVVGNGLTMATEVAKAFGHGSKVTLYESYGTAQVRFGETEVEFVGARKEFYHRESRNPIVEAGTLKDDQDRRDFTVNDMAICLNEARYGELVDPYDGISGLAAHRIQCVGDANERFSEDPLRMMRAIRFASTLGFSIHPDTLAAITTNAKRIEIITQERITEELVKVLKSKKPSIGFQLLKETHLLREIFPELHQMTYCEMRNNRRHKDMFAHTLKVLDNVAERTDDVYVRLAALLHDIGKPRVKDFDMEKGWTFYNHAHVGAGMIPGIFKRLKLPLGSEMDLVKKLVYLHMDPINLVNGVATDSAVRRLLFEAGEDIEALMILCDSDVTSRHEDKVAAVHDKYAQLKVRMAEIEEKDHLRNFKLPIDGDDIMQMFNLTPCRLVGDIKSAVKEAILDGTLENDREKAIEFAKAEYKRLTEGK